jgi:transcriptional regulator GlxA family with amidase domain
MKRIGIVVYPGFLLTDVAAASVFEAANLDMPDPAYAIDIVSEQGGPVTSGVSVAVETVPLDPHAYDTLIMAGSFERHPIPPGLVRLMARAFESTRRVASMCRGTYVLGEARILDGRRATVHWRLAEELQRRYPAIRFEADRIFVNDGKLWTAAGGVACIDLAMKLVEDDFGLGMTRRLARYMLVQRRRHGEQSQSSTITELDSSSDRIQLALAYAADHLHEDLSIESLAAVVHMSPRNFAREFVKSTGRTPARLIERIRVETARVHVESNRISIARIAAMTGFSDAAHMRRAFMRVFGAPPQTFRQTALERQATEAGSAPQPVT